MFVFFLNFLFGIFKRGGDINVYFLNYKFLDICRKIIYWIIWFNLLRGILLVIEGIVFL